MNTFQAELVVALLAAAPIIELRAAIPVGIKVYGLAPIAAFTAAVIGNVLAGVALVYLLPPIESLCVRRLPRCNLVIQRYLAHARQKFSGKYATLGALGLMVLTAMPVPILGGAWTGAAVAHVLGLPKKFSIPSIVAGVIIMGALVTFATLGVLKIV